jgi:hypothetical protein
MRVLAVLLVLTTSGAVARAGSYKGTVVYVTPDKVVIEAKDGIKTFTLSKTVKENKEPDVYYTLLHRQLVVGMRIEVDSTRKDGVDEAQGFRFRAPPP